MCLPHSPILYLGWACTSGGSVIPWSYLILIAVLSSQIDCHWTNRSCRKTQVCLKGLTSLSSAAGLFLVHVEGTALAAAVAADVYPGTNHYHYMAKKCNIKTINGGTNLWRLILMNWHDIMMYLTLSEKSIWFLMFLIIYPSTPAWWLVFNMPLKMEEYNLLNLLLMARFTCSLCQRKLLFVVKNYH